MNSTARPTGARGPVLVTGCAGFIGSHLSERLVALGHEVVGVDCFTDYYPRERKEANLARLRWHPRFDLREVDLTTAAADELLEGVERVFHLAAQPGVRGSWGDGFDVYVRQNIHVTQRLLEAATRHRPASFVYASSSSVYGDAEAYPTPESAGRRPVSPYGMSKRATEDLADVYARTAGVPVVGLRYFTVYGPRQRPDMAFSRFISDALAGLPLTVLGDGRQIRDFTYVDDAVQATIAAGLKGRPGGVYNIGGGTQVALVEAIAIIRELLGRRIEVEHRPGARGDARRTCADPRRARRDLGFAPTTPLRRGLARQIAWALELAGAERPASLAAVS